MDSPSKTEANGVAEGRKADGTFASGNQAARGNQGRKAAAEFQKTLYESVTPESFKTVLAGLIEEAMNREPWAVKELLDRLLGKARQSIDVDGLPELLKETIELVRGPVQK